MPFSKGHRPWNYAKIKVKCSYCGKSKKVSPSKVRRNIHFFCNLRCCTSWRTGRKRTNLSKEVREIYSRKRKEYNANHKGINHPSWKGGLTPWYRLIRSSNKYQEWQRAVKVRDNFTCQRCNKRGGDLASHHIKPIKDYPELAYDLNNGITYCYDCHKIIEKEIREKRNGERIC